jgi:uncharacterized protein (TIGR03437 family)
MKRILQAILSILGPILGSLLLATHLGSQTQPIPPGLQNGQAARLVLGQTNFSDITFGTSQSRLGAISGITLAGNQMIVADGSYLAPPNNNRILIYRDFDTFKSYGGGYLVEASVVVGQADFTSSAAGTARDRMNQPVGVASDGTRLFVADWGNNRVLIFQRIPDTNGAGADVVVGQDGFTTSEFGVGANRLRRPNSVATDGTSLLITDTLNNRVLLYNRIPTQNGASADLVLGQPNFDRSQALPTAANTLSSPMSATTDGQRLIVTDLGNNRVLIYNRIPTQNGATADVVVGQPDFTSSGAGNTATSLNFPRFAYSDGQRLLVVDSGNNRILIYNQIPTSNGAAPDVVLGQADFVGLLESCAASNFAVPYAAFHEGKRLFVSDSFNRRIMVFEPGPSLITLNGIVNTASFSTEPQSRACGVVLPQPPLAPGGIASIFGQNLAGATEAARSLPLPTKLGGVRVRFDGYDAPLFFVSPTQINLQIPFELTGYSSSVEIERDTPSGPMVSAASPAALSTGAPGIFTYSGDGRGPGLVFHTDFSPVTDESPARPGETLIAYVTGLGTVDNPVASGAASDFAASGRVTIGGTVGAGQTITIRINGRDHTYTTVDGDTLDTILQHVAEVVTENDPEVSATVGSGDDISVVLRARSFGEQGTNIVFNAFLSEGATLTVSTGLDNFVPRNIVIGGTPAPGQTLTVSLQGTNISYTIEPGDTLETILTNFADRISGDPNVVATADPGKSRILLAFRNPDAGLTIAISLSVSEDSTLTLDFEEPHFTPGVSNATNTVSATIGRSLPLVPGSVFIRGTPQTGQTVTITLQEQTNFTYTVAEGDTLQTIVTRLAELVNSDPNVLAVANLTDLSVDLQLRTANSDAEITFSTSLSSLTTLIVLTRSNLTSGSQAAIVSFAGLVPGSVGLYQVNFGVPSDAKPNPAAQLTFHQNLIVFGSVTETDIFSNPVTFPVGQ